MTWQLVNEVLQWIFLLYLWSRIGILRVDIVDHDCSIDDIKREMINNELQNENNENNE